MLVAGIPSCSDVLYISDISADILLESCLVCICLHLERMFAERITDARTDRITEAGKVDELNTGHRSTVQ